MRRTGFFARSTLPKELFKNLTGIDVVHVPYKSVSQAEMTKWADVVKRSGLRPE